MSLHLRLLGRYRSLTDPSLPDASEWVDTTWDEEARDIVADYFEGGTVCHAFLEFDQCSLCAAPIGNLELTDGTYLWPSGLSHYIRQHSVRLPAQVEAHAHQKMKLMEENLQIDREWWQKACLK